MVAENKMLMRRLINSLKDLLAGYFMDKNYKSVILTVFTNYLFSFH